MKNRIAPVSSEGVLAMISSTGLFDEQIIENVEQRLQAIYGPPKSSVLTKMRVRTAAKRKLDDLVSTHESSFLSFPIVTGPAHRPKRSSVMPKRKKAKLK